MTNAPPFSVTFAKAGIRFSSFWDVCARLSVVFRHREAGSAVAIHTAHALNPVKDNQA